MTYAHSEEKRHAEKIAAQRRTLQSFEKKNRIFSRPAMVAKGHCKAGAHRLLKAHATVAEAQFHESISWEDAQEEAGKWIGELHLPRDLSGQTLDLSEHANTLKFEGRFRRMIFEAARRKLKNRGAREVILPPA